MIAYHGVLELDEVLYLVLPWMAKGDLHCYIRRPEPVIEESFWEEDVVSDQTGNSMRLYMYLRHSAAQGRRIGARVLTQAERGPW